MTLMSALLISILPLPRPAVEGGSAPPRTGNKIEIVPHQTKICSCRF